MLSHSSLGLCWQFPLAGRSRLGILLPHAEWRPWPVDTTPPPPTDGAFRGYSGFVLSVCSDMFDISGDHTVHSGTLKRKLPKSLESVCLTLFHSFYKYRTPPGCQPYSWGQNRQTPLPSWADILWFLYQ